MGKRFAFILIALALVLTGCQAEPSLLTEASTEATILAETTAPVETTLQTETQSVATTETPTTEPTQAPTISEETQESTVPEKPEQALPYLQKIERCDQSIYDGPGYDYSFAGTVRKIGTYTIVEESEDYEGNLWGKLKSGAGWVDLTQIQSKNYVSNLIGVNYAEDRVLREVSYHHYSTNREYAVPVIFYAYGTLRDVTIFDMEFQDAGMMPAGDLFTLPEMTKEKPLVAELAFPGDMSTYGIRFVDETGSTHTYYIYMSGRNGDILLTKNVF